MSNKRYDLIVIGSGPGGEKGAAQAAYFGKKVAIIERNAVVGGVLSNSAVPGKGLRETSVFVNGFNKRDLYGFQLTQKEELNVSKVLHRSTDIRNSMVEAVGKNLEQHNIEVIHGAASFHDAHTVLVKDAQGAETFLEADVFLIATGSRPVRPGIFPFASGNVYDSDTIFSMGALPPSITIVGAGTIGCEYACIFSRLNVEVTMVDPKSQLLPFTDQEISTRLQKSMEKAGVRFCSSEKVAEMESDGNTVTTRLNSGIELKAAAAFISVGRRSNVEGLNLETVGVKTSDRGQVIVDEHFQTSQAHIYAAGDVIGFPGLASSSMEQARMAIVNAFELHYKKQVASLLPFGVWTIPEISVVGETEESLQKKGIPYVVGRAHYSKNSRGVLMGETEGLLKLIFSIPEHRLIGVHIIGEQACELISPGMIALTMGANFNTFMDTCFNFPSLADMYKYATYDAMNNVKNSAPIEEAKL